MFGFERNLKKMLRIFKTDLNVVQKNFKNIAKYFESVERFPRGDNDNDNNNALDTTLQTKHTTTTKTTTSRG